MANYLLLNPANDQKVILILFKGKKIFRLTKKYQRPLGDVFLKYMNQLVNSAKILPRDIQAVVVVNGPGSFSSLRTGVVVANTIAWSRQIPIFALAEGDFLAEKNLQILIKNRLKRKNFKPIMPFYNKEPNITKPK